MTHAVAAPLRVGLSIRTLAHPGFKGQVDGIGVYTRELWKQLDRVGAPGASGAQSADAQGPIEVHPVVGFGKQAADLVADYPKGYAFPRGFGASSLLALTGLPFPGARDARARLDVYHSTDYWMPDLGKLPLVATLHDAIPLSHPEWAVPRQRLMKNAFMRLAARRIDRVITVSASMVPVLVEQFGIAAERIVPIHNGIGDEWFEAVPPEFIRDVVGRHSLPERCFLNVGTLQPRKNLGRVLAAFRSLPTPMRRECPLVVVGRMGWGVDELKPLIESGIAAGEIRWLDWIAEDDLRAIFRHATALVFPSLYEGFGLPVVEAFASGLPVLTSTVSALPEIAGDAALKVDPFDVDAIRDAMARLASDDALRARLSVAGLERARRFSWRTSALQVAAVYRQVA